MTLQERDKWTNYLKPEVTPTYGTYSNRVPEYQQVSGTLLIDLGFGEDDSIVDIGAGSCDMDRFLRATSDFSFKYLPVDGATFGIDFNDPTSWELLNNIGLYADYYVSIETIEHFYDPRLLFEFAEKFALKGIVFTTPNGAAGFDVQAQDSTHYSALTETTFKRRGYEVRQHSFSGRSKVPGQEDTLIAWKKVVR